MVQSRLDSRVKEVIKNAILHRAFTEEEMLKKGIEFIVFTMNYRKSAKARD
jgi:hypothetical protein